MDLTGLLWWVVAVVAVMTGISEADRLDRPKLDVAAEVQLSALPAHHHAAHTHQAVLDPDGVFTVFWTPDLNKQEVVWEIHVRTPGWLGFGFSSSGGMTGGDMITAWVKDGRLFLQDRHGVGELTPPLDNHADWRPLHARENDTHTLLVVARDINTCDPHDYILTNETVRLLYAWGDSDPSNEHPSYHGPRRGNKFAFVLMPFYQKRVPEDAQVWRVSQSITLPHKQDTFYWCHVEKIPKWQKKHHYIGFRMIYGKNARSNLHHSIAYECHMQDGTNPSWILEQYVGHPGYVCYTPNMPEHFYQCRRFLIVWATGSEGEMLPERVGVPMGDLHGGATYLLFETHYDNYKLKREITVDWTMDIYYTDKLRQEEAGNLALGHSMVFSLTVPPRTPFWRTVGHCASDCTALAIPSQGVNVFNVMLHGHFLARAIRVRHFRGNVELPPLMEDLNYAANFQQSHVLPKEVKVMPGDHFAVECDCDSSNRDNATFLGWKVRDEMCNAFLSYYPRIDLAHCRSSPHPEILKKVFRLKSLPENLNLVAYIYDPEVGDGRRYQEAVNTLPWDTLDRQLINNRITYGDHVIQCQYNYGVCMKLSTNLTRYPRAAPYVPPEDKACAHVPMSAAHLVPSSGHPSTPMAGLVSTLFLTVMLASLAVWGALSPTRW